MSDGVPTIGRADRGAFDRDGFLTVRTLLSIDEADACREECQRLEARPELWHEVGSAAPHTDAAGRPPLPFPPPLARPPEAGLVAVGADGPDRGDVQGEADPEAPGGHRLPGAPGLFVLGAPGNRAGRAHHPDAGHRRSRCRERSRGLLPAGASAPPVAGQGGAEGPRPRRARRAASGSDLPAAGRWRVFHSLTPHDSRRNTSHANRRCWFTSWAPARHAGKLASIYPRPTS